MSSPQVIDAAKRQNQLESFFKQMTQEKHRSAAESADEAKRKVLADTAVQPGLYMTRTAFSSKLRTINPSLLFEQSVAYPEQGGIYVRRDGANADDLNPANRNRSFITGMCWGMIPENTQWELNRDKFNEPQPRIVRKGWRDTLKVLIQMRLVGIEEVERAFGSGGKNWHLQLH